MPRLRRLSFFWRGVLQRWRAYGAGRCRTVLGQFIESGVHTMPQAGIADFSKGFLYRRADFDAVSHQTHPMRLRASAQGILPPGSARARSAAALSRRSSSFRCCSSTNRYTFRRCACGSFLISQIISTALILPGQTVANGLIFSSPFFRGEGRLPSAKGVKISQVES